MLSAAQRSETSGIRRKGAVSFEVTRDKKVVRQYTDHKTVRAVLGVQLLDVKGDAIKGEILR